MRCVRDDIEALDNVLCVCVCVCCCCCVCVYIVQISYYSYLYVVIVYCKNFQFAFLIGDLHFFLGFLPAIKSFWGSKKVHISVSDTFLLARQSFHFSFLFFIRERNFAHEKEIRLINKFLLVSEESDQTEPIF